MPPFNLASSTPAAANNERNKNPSSSSSSSFLPADRRAARRGLWRDWAQAPEQGPLFAVSVAGGGQQTSSAVSEWATAWLAASTAESDLTSMLHNEVMVRACVGRGLDSNEAEEKGGARRKIFDEKNSKKK